MLLLLVVGIGIGYFGWKYVLSRTSPNEKELLPAIHEAAQKHHLEPELVRAVLEFLADLVVLGAIRKVEAKMP